jgi:hypothetical protein
VTLSTSIFIARLLGPVFALIGVALILKVPMYRTVLKEFIGSAALVYLAGFLGLVAGLALVLVHNVWVADWPVLITLIGWITITRSLVTLYQPQRIVAMGSRILERPALFRVAAALNLALGVLLSYFGYRG